MATGYYPKHAGHSQLAKQIFVDNGILAQEDVNFEVSFESETELTFKTFNIELRSGIYIKTTPQIVDF